jgi:hypothetical protein
MPPASRCKEAASSPTGEGAPIRLACEIAGVEPKFQKIDGQDQKAYILSVYINRRHMTAAQRAMAVAMIYPVAPRGRGKKDEALKGDGSSSFSHRRLQYARVEGEEIVTPW